MKNITFKYMVIVPARYFALFHPGQVTWDCRIYIIQYTLYNYTFNTMMVEKWPVCQERKGRKGKDSEVRMARKVFALG